MITASQLIQNGLVQTKDGWVKRRSDTEPVSAEAVSDEAELHNEIEAYCRAKRWAYVHSRMDRATTTNLGVPDYIVIADHGRVFIIECKARKNKLTPAQLGFKVLCEMNGHWYYMVRSFEEFLKVVTQ